MDTKNKWDALAKYFFKNNVSSADNVDIIEPILIKELTKIENLRVIDFGCGSGNFCKKIAGFADSVLGVDSSLKMINIAKSKNAAKNIEYTNKSIYEVDASSFNVFNAEFVVQFISDEELNKILTYISDNDIQKILISNDRLEFIDQSIKDGNAKFSKDGDNYFIQLSGEKVNIFPRTINLLKHLFFEKKFELENSYELKYPKSFIRKFPEVANFPTDLAAYTVMVFKKMKD